MPFVLYLLGLAVFAQATSEFMLAGLGPDIARDLGVSIPAAGWLTSAFALGMIVGAPAIAVLGARWPRRRTLLLTLTVFLAVHVIGVPAGAVLGRYLGWRSAFWAVAIISLPALLGILRAVPSRGAGPATVGRFHLRPRLAVLLLLGALVNGATFCSFTYLSPVLTEVTGLGVGWVPPMLALFGLGSFAGVTVAGRYADRRDDRFVLVAGGILLVGWCTFALTAAAVVPTVLLVLLVGALSFAVGSTLIAYSLYAGSATPVLTGGLATAALNVGAAAGPLLGGPAIGAAGFRGPLWVSAALVGVALVAGGSIKIVDREGPG
ncbi:MFS transporter [Kribbella sp. NPDC003505]|uniref:MFS transporter n=1 Tax=Kribbella sp. NPDC003505 TaxID=3154448 RepID=UPI0033BB1893